ncbi:MAG: hypothetical protein ACTHM2_05140 [Afipia sp.]
MNKADRELAASFLLAAGIASIGVDADGSIGPAEAHEVLDPTSDSIFFCCTPNNQARILDAIQHCRSVEDKPQAVSLVLDAAQKFGIRLTPHQSVITRAKAVVDKVHQTFDDMKNARRLKDLNKQFAAERKAGNAGSYAEYVRAKKVRILEAIAQSS